MAQPLVGGLKDVVNRTMAPWVLSNGITFLALRNPSVSCFATDWSVVRT